MALVACRLDESSDQKQEDVFVVAGLFAYQMNWLEVERLWEERLDRDSIPYFHASDCEHVRGEFERFRARRGSLSEAEKQRAELVRSDLIKIITSEEMSIVGVAMVMADFKKIVTTNRSALELFSDDPYHLTYSLAFTVVANAIKEFRPAHVVAFVCDQNETHSAQALASYKDFCAKNADLDPHLGSLNYLDDRKSPALQAADLVAYEVMRKCRSWLKNDKSEREQIKRLKPRIYFVSACNRLALGHLVKNNMKYLKPNVVHGTMK